MSSLTHRRRPSSLCALLLFPLSLTCCLAGIPAARGQAGAAPAASASSPGAAGPAPTGQAAGAPGAQTGAGRSAGANGAANGNQSNQQNAGSREASANRNADQNAQNETRNNAGAGFQGRLTEFQALVASTTGRTLPIFGESLFGGVPSTFAPVDDVPVGTGYTLGPGDEVNLQLSGPVNQQFSLVVDRTGAISIPGLGAVHVAGMPYGQLPAFLNTELGRIYRNFQLNANLGALRTIQVFVVGQAQRPGAFSISSLSTLTNAIFASGGPLPEGSLRDIHVIRGGQTINHFDLYDLLLRGDKTHDVQLMSGDVIYIPPVGPQVALVGSVDTPAIYELKGETSLADLLKVAGGPTPVASVETVRLERIDQHAVLQIQDVAAAMQPSLLLQNGDILSVTSIVDRFRNAVTLRGNVANPGRYVWHPGMRISDLLPNKEALITRNYWEKRNQLGQLLQDYIPVPNDAQAGQGALGLQGTSQTVAADVNAQTGNGAGAQGGNSIASALTASGGAFTARNDVVLSAPDINWSYAVIERQSTADLTTSLIPFDLGSIVLEGKADQNYELLPNDIVTIFSKADLRVPSKLQTRFVRLEGEFNHVGVYSVLPGETLRGLLRRAGGLTPDAYLYASEFTRESTRRVEQQRLSEYADQLEAQISATTASNQARAVSATDQTAAAASAANAETAVARLRRLQPIGRIVLDLHPDSRGIEAVPDIALEDGDRFVVPRVPANVNVEGQVYSANAFVYADRAHVADYLHRAGGPDRQADRKRMFVLRADGSVISQQYNNVERAAVYPGDTIVVPPTLDRRSVFQKVLDVATIASSLGVGIAAVALLATR